MTCRLHCSLLLLMIILLSLHLFTWIKYCVQHMSFWTWQPERNYRIISCFIKNSPVYPVANPLQLDSSTISYHDCQINTFGSFYSVRSETFSPPLVLFSRTTNWDLVRLLNFIVLSYYFYLSLSFISHVLVFVGDLSPFVQPLQVSEQLFCLNHCCSHRRDPLLLGRDPLQHFIHLHSYTHAQTQACNQEVGTHWLVGKQTTSVLTPAGSWLHSAAAGGTVAASGGVFQRNHQMLPPCLWVGQGA